MKHIRRLIDNLVSTDFIFPPLMARICMKHGIKSKLQSRNSIESSIRLRNLIQGSSMILKTTTEERIECQKEREKDGLKITHTSSEDSQKKNSYIETTTKLIWKMTQKMIMLKICLIRKLQLRRGSSSSENTISLKLVCLMNPMKITMMQLSTNYLSTSTDSAMTMRRLIKEDKAGFSADLQRELKVEIQSQSKTYLTYISKI